MENRVEVFDRPEDLHIILRNSSEYTCQFHNSGDNINLYNFSKIDFDGEFSRVCPRLIITTYNILDAARVRSRLRMGLSREQLVDRFPDRMTFSRFQTERGRERNHHHATLDG
jgi:DNA excision repair protein ERCC-5